MVMTRWAPMVVMVGTNGQPILEYTLPLHLCPALQWILHLCRGSEQRASQATVPLCRPACPTSSDQRCCLLSRPMMPNAINNGNLSLQSFLTFQDTWKVFRRQSRPKTKKGSFTTDMIVICPKQGESSKSLPCKAFSGSSGQRD